MNLAEKVYYDPTSPTFLRWRFGFPGASKDSVAGHITTKSDGRRVVHITVNRNRLQGHRVVWVLHHGDIADDIEIDHEDGDSINNAIKNLRLATRIVNARNKRKQVNNKTGTTGVSLSWSRTGVPVWRAVWCDECGKVKSQSFSESVYGEFAELLAIDKRQLEVSKLAHYTERHGM